MKQRGLFHCDHDLVFLSIQFLYKNRMPHCKPKALSLPDGVADHALMLSEHFSVFINEIADLEKETPSLLGTYFKDLVERVSKKKADSTAALSRKIEAQFKQQLDTAKKQNEDLQKKISELTKANAEAQKLHDEQVKAAQKQLDELAKGNGIARQKDREQMDALQKKLSTLTETSKNQSDNFTKQLGKMQDNINSLTSENKTLTSNYAREKERNASLERSLKEAEKKINGKWAIVAALIVAILIILGLIMN